MKTRLLTTSAIAGLALLVLNPAAYANGGAGGTGSNGTGGAGGVTSTTGAGTNGSNSSNAVSGVNNSGGGGGGGAGITGGNGGRGGDTFTPLGAGGSAPGAAGQYGENGGTKGAHGGGGGAHGYVGATLPVATATGGAGGYGGSSTGGGGGGGAGGYGAVFSGSSITGSIANNLTGGAGGNGGNGGGIAGNFAGRGGAGGIGLLLTGSLNNITISSTITGGKGGNSGSSVSAVSGTDGSVGLALGSDNAVTLTGSVTGGNGGTATSGGAVGAGAAAITGSDIDLTIGSTGVVTAGLSGSSARAHAIHFTGGSNTLALATGAAITGNIVGAGTDALTLNGATTGSFDISTLNGFSTLAKSGAGTWTLTGASNYTGATTVTAGRLAVNGTTTSSSGTTVSGTGILGGTGTVRNVVLNSGGTLAAGNSIGTLNVTGTIAFNSGSSYDVEFSPTDSDHTIATGAITIDSGATLNLLGGAGTYDPSRTYTILTGSAITGTFGTVTNDLAFLDETLIYNAGTVQVRMDRNDTDFAAVVSPDYASAANAVTGLGMGNTLYDTILNLTSEAAASAIQQLSGQQNAVISNAIASIMSIATNNVSSRINNFMTGGAGFDVGANTPSADGTYTAAYLEPAAGGHAFGKGEIWGQAVGGLGRTDDDGATPGQKSRNYGFIGGLDQPVSDNTYLGAYAGYVHTHTQTDNSQGDSDIGSYQVGLYAAHNLQGGFMISGGVGVSYNDIDSKRNVTVGGLTFSPEGDTNGTSLTAYAELSKQMTIYDMAMAPFINIGLTRSRTNGFTEENGGPANLTVDDNTTTNPTSTLGARIGKTFDQNGQSFNVTGKLGWQHTYGDVEPDTTMQFASGSASFQSTGLPIARDAAVIGIDVDTQLGNGVTGFAGYDGTLSSDNSNHGFTLGAKMKF